MLYFGGSYVQWYFDSFCSMYGICHVENYAVDITKRGARFLGGGAGWGGGGGLDFLCVLQPTCMDLDPGPKPLFVLYVVPHPFGLTCNSYKSPRRLVNQSQAGVYRGKHHILPHFGPFWAYSCTLPQGVEFLF